jgi:hypothetical protein
MARKTSRTPRPPVAPSPVARSQPRRPSGAVPAVGVSTPTASRSEADYSAELTHVRKDLSRIVVVAVLLFGVIFAAPYLIK